MSEQDKKSGGSGGSVVMVEKSASSRHKPYRPTELQDEPAPDLHKRSKAPAVPSVAEELKDTTVSETPATVDRMECERAMSSEKHMHVPKNISSTGKRRGNSPEEITMVSLDANKRDTIAPPAPIPVQVEKVVSEASGLEAVGKMDEEKKADDDSITEEITDLRTPEAAVKEHSEWSDDEEAGGLPRSESRASRVSRAMRQLFCCGVAHHAPSEEEIPPREFSALNAKSIRTMKEEFNPIQSVIDFNVSKKAVSKSTPHIISTKQVPKKTPMKLEKEALKPSYSANIKKKEISWKDSEYLDNVRLEDLNAKSQAAILERKPSIGPCFKPRMLYGGPSGITVCVPKKSIRTMKEEFNPIQSVIDFNVSKKAVTKSTPHIISTKQVPKKTPMKLEKEALKIDDDQQHIKFLGVLRTKLDNMSGRIRNLLNM
ncbi:uncharacterized protein LOC114362359 [Ostrinia furnacalis]|uniref:uncharacterized protein LOC114362359 n=1 Tax=Ostrinia furnacalis TaxID=93504 RepID=UPI00103BBD04|nr:uncharacterized protein LOC114362359 [Ostrinia furnacalis]